MDSAVLLSRDTAAERSDYESTGEKRALPPEDVYYSPDVYESGLSYSMSVTELGESVYQYKSAERSFMTVPCPSLNNSEDGLLWTKPKLLRKKEAELSRCKELLSKKSTDCANAVCGERFAVERQAELKRKLCCQKNDFEMMKRIERLRNRERLVCDTERLRGERDEAQITLTARDLMIKRLTIRVRQLEQMEKQKEAEIGRMKRELDAKNTTLKNLLRKLVLAQFSKKKS